MWRDGDRSPEHNYVPDTFWLVVAALLFAACGLVWLIGACLRPTRVVQTHGLVIPAILEWQGNLVTTSIKPDVLRATCAHRANLGAVWVYDPLGLAGVPGARWTPLAHCPRTWPGTRPAMLRPPA
jgi:hypothetical protein